MIIIESIALIIFLVSLCGILVILVKKVPVLNTLSQNGTTGFKKHHYILEVEQKIKEILISFEKQIWLHKILSWVKVMTLKIEIQVDHLLHGIRRKAQQVDKDLIEKK
jgi:hypothetical protein